MIYINIIDLFYGVLLVFTSIIGTLLVLILMRVMKILWPLVELANTYERIKKMFQAYSSIPDMVKQKISEIISGK